MSSCITDEQASSFTPDVSQVTEVTETTTIRSDRMDPVTPAVAKRPRPNWTPYYSKSSSRQQRLDEALKKYGPPTPAQIDPESPFSVPTGFLGITDVAHTRPFYSVQPCRRQEYFNGLPSYGSISTFSGPSLRAEYQGSEIYSQLSFDAVWDGDQIVPSTDRDTPALPSTSSPDLSSSTPERWLTLDAKKQSKRTICAGVGRMIDRVGEKAKQSTLPVRTAAATLPTKIRLKAASLGRRRPELDFEVLNQSAERGKRLRMAISDSTFRSHERQARERERRESPVAQDSERSWRGTVVEVDEEWDGTSGISRTAVVGRHVKKEDGREMSGTSRKPTTGLILARPDSNIRLTPESFRLVLGVNSRLPVLSHRRKASTSSQLLGPMPLSDTIRRAPDSIHSTHTPAFLSSQQFMSSRRTSQSPRPTQSQSQSLETIEDELSLPRLTLNQLLRTTTLNDILDAETAQQVGNVLRSAKHDQQAAIPHRLSKVDSLHHLIGENEAETRLKCQQLLHNVDINAAQQLRAQQSRHRFSMPTTDYQNTNNRPLRYHLPRQKPPATSKLPHTFHLHLHESPKNPSPNNGNAAHAPLTGSRLRHVQSADSEVLDTNAETESTIVNVHADSAQRANHAAAVQAEPRNSREDYGSHSLYEQSYEDDTEVIVSTSGLLNSSVLCVGDGDGDGVLSRYRVDVEDGGSGSEDVRDEDEESRRVRKGKDRKRQ